MFLLFTHAQTHTTPWDTFHFVSRLIDEKYVGGWLFTNANCAKTDRTTSLVPTIRLIECPESANGRCFHAVRRPSNLKPISHRHTRFVPIRRHVCLRLRNILSSLLTYLLTCLVYSGHCIHCGCGTTKWQSIECSPPGLAVTP